MLKKKILLRLDFLKLAPESSKKRITCKTATLIDKYFYQLLFETDSWSNFDRY